MDEAVLVHDDVVGEHAVEPAGQHRAVGGGQQRVAVEPVLEHGGGHAVAQLHTGDARADLDDLAGGIRARE